MVETEETAVSQVRAKPVASQKPPNTEGEKGRHRGRSNCEQETEHWSEEDSGSQSEYGAGDWKLSQCNVCEKVEEREPVTGIDGPLPDGSDGGNIDVQRDDDPHTYG